MRSDTVVAVFEVDVFCARSVVPSGAKSDAFQQPPEQLGKVTSNITVPFGKALMVKLSFSVETAS